MSEIIATWAGHIGAIALLIMWTAWTIQAIALGNAGWAAIASPFAVLGWVIAAVAAAQYFGWIATAS